MYRGESYRCVDKQSRADLNLSRGSEMRDRGIRGGVFGTGLACISIFVFFSVISCSQHPVYPEPPRTALGIEIDIKTLKPDIPRFFTYHYNKKNINFFVFKTNDAVLSFFDACAKCYPQKLGYRFDDGFLACKACNERYSVSEVGKGFGSCFPIRLSGNLRQGKYIIPVAELEKAVHRF